MAKRGKSKAKGKQPAKAAEPVIKCATPEPAVEQAVRACCRT